MRKLTIEELEKSEKNMLSAAEVARAMGISINTFYEKHKQMKFPVERIGRKYIIRKEPFLAYLRAERERTMSESNNSDDSVITVCYGKTEVWESREAARKFFLDAMMNSEGSEKDRYTNVYFGILRGYSRCTDSDE